MREIFHRKAAKILILKFHPPITLITQIFLKLLLGVLAANLLVFADLPFSKELFTVAPYEFLASVYQELDLWF
ncbi:MAG: hypothetical protein U9Q70_08040 [Chloroflexota bacterium]|nr:hypothetical protein [Chloroflexota bacterium]